MKKKVVLWIAMMTLECVTMFAGTFNANAYRVPEGSTLEALVKQLPGAKVDKEGNITINGKKVTKILVDGKEFFLNDKDVAMKKYAFHHFICHSSRMN